MSGVALNGSEIKLSTKSNYIRFRYDWTESDGEGGRDPRHDYGNTDADVIGKVTCTNQIFLNGVSLAIVGDKTTESWKANPPPSAPRGRITSVTPGRSGSGEGEVSGGSTKVFYKGKAVALIGSSVKTMLDTDTNIETGGDKINISS
ncbi:MULTISPECIES: hypothetical protein [Paenibacillus]|uniref:Baseplate assembly protein n=2 Tax=Paenibacillus TaxID=44249 RepID=A0ABX2ZA14_PAEPO|nr:MULTISPECIES: hypothetical protein [Paenibacillus]MDR6779316.1 putative Zn-binding protein involved in type VI secretion [Paenibacillus peoriae]ODA08120.1 hypothetical protein A7312_08815 [Paenibacillus polymyxa]